MKKQAVRLEICSSVYNIATDVDVEYARVLGARLDEKMRRMIGGSNSVSVTQAAVLAALDYADEANRAQAETQRVRSQLKEYLEDAAKAKSERDFYRRELERLRDAKNGDENAEIWG